MAQYEGYCMKCREKRTFEGEIVTLKNGRPAAQGACPVCGTKLTRILSKADAEAVYTPQWKAYIAERYGTSPDIRYFETSVVVDNESEKTILDAAA